MKHVKPYVYKPELRELLILPQQQKDLIDVLTGDMGVLVDVFKFCAAFRGVDAVTAATRKKLAA